MVAQPVQAARQEPATWRRSTVLLALFGVLALAGVAVAGYWLGTQGSDDGGAALVSTDSDTGTAEATDDGSGDEADADPESPVVAGDSADGNDDGASGDGATDGDAVESDYEAPEVDLDQERGFESDGVDELGRPIPVLPDVLYPNAENPAAVAPVYSENPIDAPTSGPYTVIEAGFFFLRGSLPSEAFRQELIQRNLAILPEEQMVVEYTIDPESTWYFGDPIPVFLQDKLLFDVGSTDVNPAFLPLFQIGTNLLNLDDRITITIVGHTDSEGDEALNLALSEGRVNAVKEVYIGLGANPDQIEAIGKGESEPLADNATAEGRALNRRVEFIITSSEADGATSG
jgi:outer membrane protein OmpA-like peptidoglycan-associated protein